MRILHTAHSYPPDVSGVAEVVSQISRRLADRGHEVYVATRRTHDSSDHEMLDGVHVYRFPITGNDVFGISGPVNEYRNFIRSRHWDVIAMHCAQVWTTDTLLAEVGSLEAAMVFVFHGISALSNPQYQTYFNDLSSKLKTVDALVGLSPMVEDAEFCRKFNLPAPIIIPNGADIAIWAKAPDNIRDAWGIQQRPWIVTVSNHNPLKGHAAFLRLAKRVKRQVPNLVATIIGGHYPAARYNCGALGIRGGCWYRCTAYNFLHRVVDLRPRAMRAEVISAVKEADIVICTSSWEASPLSIMESMAAATPWISFDVGCARENAGGVVVNSLDEMNQTVLKLLAYPDLRATLGSQGKVRACAKHDWTSIVSQYEDLYTALCKSKYSRQ